MEKKPVKLFALYFFINNALLAIASVQRIPYLNSLNYSPSERSYMLSSLALLSIIGQIIMGYLSDKHKTIKKIVLIVIGSFTISTFFLYNYDQQLFIYHFLFITLSGSLQNILVDLIDSWAMQSGEEVLNNFSLIKGFQSFGYVSGAMIGSIVISQLGYKAFSAITLGVGLLLFIVALFISDKDNLTSAKIKISDIMVLIKSKTYLLSIVLFMAYFTIIQIHAISIAEKILYLGGSENHVAMRVVIAVGLEAVAYLFCDKIYRKIGSFKMLFIAAIGYIVMYFLFAQATTPNLMVIFASLQIFTVPFYIVGMKHLNYQLSPPALKTSGQLFTTATLIGVSGTLTPLLVGYLNTNYGIDAPLYAAIGFALFAIVMIVVTKKSLTLQEN